MEVKSLLPPVPKKPIPGNAPNRVVPKRLPSDLYYYSYNELGESDQQFLSDYWKAIDLQFQPVSPEMAKLVLGLTDFPPIPFAKTVTDDHSVSMSERLLSCLIPENDSQGSCSFPLSSVSQSLECVHRYYTTNSDRFRKRIRSDNTFDEESWVSRASLRHMEDLDQAIKNELESMDLWDDGEECGRVLEMEDPEIEKLVRMVWEAN